MRNPCTKQKGLAIMSIAIALRNKQLVALIVLVLLTVLAITFVVLNAVAHVNMFYQLKAIIFPYG